MVMVTMRTWTFLLQFLLLLITSIIDGWSHKRQQKEDFDVSVVEIAPVWSAYAATHVTQRGARNVIQQSLDKYEMYVTKAKQRESNMRLIVFPQHGIHGIHKKNHTLRHFLFVIDPNPQLHPWNPCKDIKDQNPWSALRRLSCMAKNNNISLVANIGERENCNTTLDVNCPDTSYYQFSTTVCFDSSGKLVARHRACHLSHADQFVYNQQIPCEYSPIPTDFGKLGLATGYDLLFYDPVITLIRQYRIDHLVVPVAWKERLPFITATSFQQALAMNMHINIFAANLNIQHEGMQGSGIFSANGAKVISQKSSSRLENHESLLSGKVFKYPRAQKRKVFPPNSNFVFNSDPNNTHELKIARNVIVQAQKVDLKNKHKTKLTVCHQGLCCYFSYSIVHAAEELYIAGAYNGLFEEATSYHVQMCFLFRCRSQDINTCALRPITEPHAMPTVFKNIVIHGNFSTTHIYAQIIQNGNRLLTKDFDSAYMTLRTNRSVEIPLLSSVLMGRPYYRDDSPYGHSSVLYSRTGRVISSVTVVISLIVLQSILILYQHSVT